MALADLGTITLNTQSLMSAQYSKETIPVTIRTNHKPLLVLIHRLRGEDPVQGPLTAVSNALTTQPLFALALITFGSMNQNWNALFTACHTKLSKTNYIVIFTTT